MRDRPFRVAALAWVLTGCTGAITGSGPAPANTPPPPGTSPPPPGTSPPPMIPGACTKTAAPARLRALTLEQYDNTIRDLLGVDDQPSRGFTRTSDGSFAASVHLSALEAEQRLRAAERLAVTATTGAALARTAGCDPSLTGCADSFIDHFGRRAFRRPLATDERKELRGLFDAGAAAGGFAQGAQWVISAVLQSPQFLYLTPPDLGAAPSGLLPLGPYQVATRLSYFFWNSIPDEPLFAAAAAGKLSTRSEIEAQAQRLLADPKSARTRHDFYRRWLDLDLLRDITREDPNFSAALAETLEASLLAGVDGILTSKEPTMAALLRSSVLWADERMAKLYGLTGVTGTAHKPVNADPTQRRGLLTHPALMMALAHHDASDPIVRGLFVRKHLICQDLPEPPDTVDTNLPPLRPGLSTRQRLVDHRANPTCRSCHAMIDPVGFAFESWDHLGRHRTKDQGVGIDSSGEMVNAADLDGPFSNGLELVDRMAGSRHVAGCFVDQVFSYAVRRELHADDACGLVPVKQQFAASGDLRALLVSVATSDAFLHVRKE